MKSTSKTVPASAVIPPPPGGGSWRWDGAAWRPSDAPPDPVVDDSAEPAATEPSAAP